MSRLRVVFGLFFLGLAAGCKSGVGQGTKGTVNDSLANARGASLGVETSAPSSAVAQEMALPFSVRVQGQEIRAVESGSPAARAGLRVGDVLLQIGENTLFSQDDLQDLLGVSKAGDSVEVRFRRAGTRAEERTTVALGKSRVGEQSVKSKGLDWEFASLAQLPRALEKAQASRRRLLVGLSGAET